MPFYARMAIQQAVPPPARRQAVTLMFASFGEFHLLSSGIGFYIRFVPVSAGEWQSVRRPRLAKLKAYGAAATNLLVGDPQRPTDAAGCVATPLQLRRS